MGEAFVVVLVAGSENAIALDQGIPGLEHVLRAPVGRQKPAAPVDNQDAEGELVDRGLKQATIRARRRQLVMQRGCTAQVTIQRGPVAKFGNGGGRGWTASDLPRELSLKTAPIRPFLGLLTNFATGPKRSAPEGAWDETG